MDSQVSNRHDVKFQKNAKKEKGALMHNKNEN
jgi:hypothetical protein